MITRAPVTSGARPCAGHTTKGRHDDSTEERRHPPACRGALVPALALATTGLVAASAGTVTAAPAPVQPRRARQQARRTSTTSSPAPRRPSAPTRRSARRSAPSSTTPLPRPWSSTASTPRATRSPHASWPSSRPRPSRPARTPSRSKPVQERQGHPEGEAAHDPRRVQRRTPTTTSPASWCPATVFDDRTPACPARSRTARCTTSIPNPADAVAPRTTTRCGCRTSARALQQDALHQDGHHRAGPHRPEGPGRQARHRHLRLHDAEHVRGDVQGRLHGRRRGHPVGQGARTPRRGTAPPSAPGRDGDWVAGAARTCTATRTTRPAPASSPIDAVDALAQAQPDFPWADYDIEDQADADGDGNFFEPDGVIDHLVLVHAGEDKSGGGGAEGTYAIWAHSCTVAGGYTDPGHRPEVSQLHRAARGLRRRRLRPRVRPRPRPAGPVRHLRRRRLRRRLLGPDELRLALGPDLPVDADAHGPLGQVGARLGRPARSSTRATGAAHGQRRPDLAHAQAAPRTASRSTCPTRSSPWPTPHSGTEHVVVAATTRTGPTSR